MFHHNGAAIERSGEVIAVQYVREGFSAMEFPDWNHVLRPGMIIISDLKQTYRGSHHEAVIEQIIIPRAALGLTDAEPFSPIILFEETERGGKLAAEFDRFFAEDPFGTRRQAHSRLQALLIAEIQETWRSNSDREEWWYGRRNLIRKYIDTHLDDPNLGPVQICELFNMSRATLYRMFEEGGGVRRRIQDRRLHSAIWDLATSGVKRGRLSQVSERWGFSSDANFNRAVKIAYGLPPGVLFRSSVTAKMDLDALGDQFIENDPFAEWFRSQDRGIF